MKKAYAFALGFSKSKTITFAVLLGILGAVQMYVDILRPLFGNQTTFGWFCMGLAIVVAVLRAATFQSLTGKGKSGATNGQPPAESG